MRKKRFLNILRKLMDKGLVKVENVVDHKGQLERIYRSIAEDEVIIMISVIGEDGVKSVYRNENALQRLWSALRLW
ncbi:MAG TPA: hypothetical protein ENF81_05880 [Thermotogaceae bacterium]|nr:hypothetical protein [Thermotogaceae bacterium]